MLRFASAITLGIVLHFTVPAAADPIQITAPIVELVGQPVRMFQFESPFQMTGWLRVYSDLSFTNLIFETALKGRGTATATLTQESEPITTLGPFFWEESVYRFAPPEPVPEPGTLALLAVGLVSASIARRRRDWTDRNR